MKDIIVVHDCKTKRNAGLGRRKADAVMLVHQADHLRDKILQIIVKRKNRFCLFSQNRIGKYP